MSDFQFSGSTRWNDTCVADVVMDKDGNPISCCNPITGVCLGGGGGAVAKLTVIMTNDAATGSVAAANITTNPFTEKTYVTNVAAAISTGTKIIEIPLYGDGALVSLDVEEVTSFEGDIELEDMEGVITGDATVTVVGYGNQ